MPLKFIKLRRLYSVFCYVLGDNVKWLAFNRVICDIVHFNISQCAFLAHCDGDMDKLLFFIVLEAAVPQHVVTLIALSTIAKSLCVARASHQPEALGHVLQCCLLKLACAFCSVVHWPVRFHAITVFRFVRSLPLKF